MAMMPTFAPDHEIVELRGAEIPDAASVRRELEIRAQWLTHRIRLRRIDRKDSRSEIRELAACAVLRRLLDDAYPPPEVSDTEPPPATPEALP